MSLRSRLNNVVAIVCTIALVLIPTAITRAYVSPGSPNGYVNDFAGMLSSSVKTTLEQSLRNFNQQTTNQIVVATIPSLGGDDIESYANKLFREWGIGNKSKNNGVLLVIARDDRQVRIEVGYGLEGALTDAQSHSIIRNDIVPAFKEGKYDDGISVAVGHIIDATQGEYTSSDMQQSSSSTQGDALFTIFIPFVYAIFVTISSLLARSKSWWAGGIMGGIIALVIGGFLGVSWTIYILMIIGLAGIGCLFDFLVSRTYARAVAEGRSIPWWVGGAGVRIGGGGGGGFGGFGGGSSGGGGASGRW